MYHGSKTIGPWWSTSHANKHNDHHDHGYDCAHVARLEGDGYHNGDGDYEYAPAA